MGSSGSDPRPVVGLTTYLERAAFGVWDVDAAVLPRSYLDTVVRAGGLPVLLSPVVDEPAALLSGLDALVLAGGADLDPARYGQPAHPRTGRPRPDRDTFELGLVTAALDAGLPALGVCRGAQVLNVALGGDLVQHLPERTGHDGHQPAPAVHGDTGVRVRPGSRLATILGERTTVRCYHHQALGRLGPRVSAAAWAEDGIVEGIELPDADFALGVQWHPEVDATGEPLFAALVRAASKRRRVRPTDVRLSEGGSG